MFPFLSGYISSVSVRIIQDDVKSNLGSFHIQSKIIGETRYDYIDFEMPFKSNSTSVVEALLFFDPDNFGDVNIVYERDFSYIPNLDIKIQPNDEYFTSVIKDGEKILNISYVSATFLNKFQPVEFHLIPFYFDLPTAQEINRRQAVQDQIEEDIEEGIDWLYQDYSEITGETPSMSDITTSLYRNKDDTETFLIEPNTIESFSPSTSIYYFTFPDYFFPTIYENISTNDDEEPSIKFERGSGKSFKNHLEVILKSAINNRTNTEEYVDFKKTYTYIEPDDYYFDILQSQASVSSGRITLFNDNFDLSLYQKPTHVIMSEMDGFFNSRNDIFEITEIDGDQSLPDRTKIYFKINTDFFAFVFGTDSPDYTEDVFEIEFNSIDVQDIPMSNYEEEPITGHFAVIKSNNKIYKYEILNSDSRFIVVRGKIKSIINECNYLGIFPYIANEIYCSFDSGNISSVQKTLRISRILDNGDLAYDPVNLSIPDNTSTEINCNIRDSDKGFSGIQKKVSIRENYIFYNFGESTNSFNMKVSVSSNPNSEISDSNIKKISIPIGGKNINRFSIPSKLKNRIICLDIDAPGFADKIFITINKKDGSVVEYTETVEDIIVFSLDDEDTENRYLEIKIDPVEVDYSKIEIDFITS